MRAQIPLSSAAAAIAATAVSAALGPVPTAANASNEYTWSRVTDSAAFPGGYNFPVFVVDGEMWALHGDDGAYRSTDARTWVRTQLPNSGLNAAYQKYVQLGDAVYALGTMTGNYLDLHLTTRIARTLDLRTWEVVAATSHLPARVFYAAAVHHGRIFMMGGFDGRTYYNDVWTSRDAVHWTRALEHAPWSARNTSAVVFRDRLWILGGGVIDGEKANPNPASDREVWSSADGVTWTKAPSPATRSWGGTPIAWDGKLWMIASNRNSTFAPSLVVTDDGATWREEQAPWSPRGAPAVWVYNDALYLAGGKYSTPVNGQPQFIYRNDVWVLRRRSS